MNAFELEDASKEDQYIIYSSFNNVLDELVCTKNPSSSFYLVTLLMSF